MRKRNNLEKILGCALLSIILLFVHAQTAFSQVQQIQSSFENYSQHTLQEKIYAHTDKSTYIAGEILWVKIYCIDASSHKPLGVSKVAYVDVIGTDNSTVLQAKIALKDGTGNGSLNIPVTIANGSYKLRGYTNWMKNFGPDYVFEKRISIINTLRSPEAAKAIVPSYDVQFFPEGGALVAGITSTVAFKGTAPNGNGFAFTGAIVDQQNDTVVKFQPLKFGMGRFTFTPVAGKIYRAVIKAGGSKLIKKDLPAANNTGYVMQLNDAGEDLQIKTATNSGGGKIYLFAHTGNQTKVALEAELSNGVAQFTVNKSRLSDGVSHFTVFNSNRQPVCERLYFKRPKQELFVVANSNMRQYTARKKVDVAVAAKNATGKLLPAEFSMSVYRLDSLQAGDQEDINAYLWLSSDLRGKVEQPSYYLNGNNADADQAADDLMLTQGWRRFQWSSILQNKPAAFNFLPEYNGHIITAKVTNAANQPASNVIAYMAVLGKRVQLYPAKSDSAGKLLFNTKDFYNPSEVVVQTNNLQDTSNKLQVLSPFYEQYSNEKLPPFNLSPGMQQSLKENHLSMQVQNAYAGNKLKLFHDPQVDSGAFYGNLFKAYKLDDYTRFITMEEVLKEYIREAQVSRSSKKYHITLINAKGPLNGDPLVMLDGIPEFDMDKVMAIDPLKVRKLEVVPRRYYLGPSAHEGILSLTTYKGDLGGTEIDPRAVVIDYEGMQVEREFYSPVYQTDNQIKSRLPDFRNVLFWSPRINTNDRTTNTVSFYTSDEGGRYVGILHGIAANGEAGSGVFTFEVK